MAAQARHEVESLTKRIVELTAELEAAAADVSTAETNRVKLGDPVDTGAISARLTAVQDTNAAIREGQEYRKVAATLAERRRSPRSSP